MRDTLTNMSTRPDACIMCEHTVEEAKGEIGYTRIQTGEWICDSCLKLLRSWKSETDFMLLTSDRLPDVVAEAIDEAFPVLAREVNAILEDADVDFEITIGEGLEQNATTGPDGERISE